MWKSVGVSPPGRSLRVNPQQHQPPPYRGRRTFCLTTCGRTPRQDDGRGGSTAASWTGT
ncbi:hypothetical protein DAI22_07g165300 [Oryza sativa Japonica Group]|nr:hypothetical protein DAI22_07g165300 [Oryza sativa Japonica Group]